MLHRLLGLRSLPSCRALFARSGTATVTTARPLSNSSVVAMGHGSHTSDNDPRTLEAEKQRNLTGKTPEIVPGQPGWNPNLASDSEAAVRAEKAPSMDVAEMQEHTIKMVQHLHHEGEAEVPDEVHDPSGSPAIQANLKDSQQKLKDAHHPL